MVVFLHRVNFWADLGQFCSVLVNLPCPLHNPMQDNANRMNPLEVERFKFAPETPKFYKHHQRRLYLMFVFLILGSCTMNPSVKVWWEPSAVVLFWYRGTQTVKGQGRWLLITLNDITYPCTVNVATIKFESQKQFQHIFLLKYSPLHPTTNFQTVLWSFEFLLHLITFLVQKKNMGSADLQFSNTQTSTCELCSIVMHEKEQNRQCRETQPPLFNFNGNFLFSFLF